MRFTTLLDTLTAGQSALDAAHRLVEHGDPTQAERVLTAFITDVQPVLEHSHDLPAEYVDLLGQTLSRCLVARAAARVEQALSGESGADLLLRAARSDASAVGELPAEWLDQKTQTALGRVKHVLEPAAA